MTSTNVPYEPIWTEKPLDNEAENNQIGWWTIAPAKIEMLDLGKWRYRQRGLWMTKFGQWTISPTKREMLNWDK